MSGSELAAADAEVSQSLARSDSLDHVLWLEQQGWHVERENAQIWNMLQERHAVARADFQISKTRQRRQKAGCFRVLCHIGRFGDLQLLQPQLMRRSEQQT